MHMWVHSSKWSFAADHINGPASHATRHSKVRVACNNPCEADDPGIVNQSFQNLVRSQHKCVEGRAGCTSQGQQYLPWDTLSNASDKPHHCFPEKQVAVKVVKLLPDASCTNQLVMSLRKELLILLHTTASLPHLCRYVGATMKGLKLMIVMQLYKESLNDLILKQPGLLSSDMLHKLHMLGLPLCNCFPNVGACVNQAPVLQFDHHLCLAKLCSACASVHLLCASAVFLKASSPTNLFLWWWRAPIQRRMTQIGCGHIYQHCLFWHTQYHFSQWDMYVSARDTTWPLQHQSHYFYTL